MKPKIGVCVPADSTDVERKAFYEAFYQAGAGKVFLSEESIEKMNQSLPSSYHILVEIASKKEKEQIQDEIWKEVCKDKIPVGTYQNISMSNHESGMVVVLANSMEAVKIKFGHVIAMRTLEKKAIPDNLYSDAEVKKFREDNFKNVIYQIENGEFCRAVRESGRGKAWTMNSNHYIIISEIYTIEVLSKSEPDIMIEKVL